jgi:hypothetical protein
LEGPAFADRAQGVRALGAWAVKNLVQAYLLFQVMKELIPGAKKAMGASKVPGSSIADVNSQTNIMHSEKQNPANKPQTQTMLRSGLERASRGGRMSAMNLSTVGGGTMICS